MNLPLQFSGEEKFRSPPDRVYLVITDLDLMAANIPDLTTSQRVGENQLQCVVRPGVGFLRGTLKLNISVRDQAPTESATLQIAARGIGAEVDVSSSFKIEPTPDGSLLRWTADVAKIGGLAATLSPTLIQGAAQKVIATGWQKVREQLGEA